MTMKTLTFLLMCVGLFSSTLFAVTEGSEEGTQNDEVRFDATTGCTRECFDGPHKCYRFCSGARGIRRAALTCLEHGESLLTIDTPGEAQDVSELIKEKFPGQEKLWHLGGKYMKGELYWFHLVEKSRRQASGQDKPTDTLSKRPKTYRMVKTSSFSSFLRADIDWKLYKSKYSQCLILSTSPRRTDGKPVLYKWSCWNKEGINFICQQKKPTSSAGWCTPKCYLWFGKCYKLCTGVQGVREAGRVCLNHNASLLTIDIDGEMEFLFQFLENSFPGARRRWYTSGKYEKGQWYWHHLERQTTVQSPDQVKSRGIANEKPKYSNFTRPIFSGFLTADIDWMVLYFEARRCLALETGGDNGRANLSNHECWRKKGIDFICQREPKHVLPVATSNVCGRTIWGLPADPPPDGARQKIVGGTAAVPTQYPWQARLVESNPGLMTHRGGATIINEFWLVTAAHVVSLVKNVPLNTLRIVVGDINRGRADDSEQIFEINSFTTHWRFDLNKVTEGYDIALISVKPQNGRGIVFNHYVQPACLPPPNTPYTPGLRCLISGWGGETLTGGPYSEELKGAHVPLLNKRICNKFYRYFDVSGSRFPSKHLGCAGFPETRGVDTAPGDSGGPLVCPLKGAYTLTGVTSFGAMPYGESPGFYTLVQPHLIWIKSTIRDKSPFMKQRKMPKWPETEDANDIKNQKEENVQREFTLTSTY